MPDFLRGSYAVWTLALGMLLVGACGGGGGTDTADAPPVVPPSGPVSVLTWNPPADYADNTTLDPYRDLDHYEIYVRSDDHFTDGDVPLAVIAAVSDSPAAGAATNGKVLDTEFVLDNIRPYIDGSTIHYVSLKAVGVDGQKSDFMPAILWDQS
jgi:hypothetical protein